MTAVALKVDTGLGMLTNKRVWILTYMDPSKGSGVERFVSNLSVALKDGGYDVRTLDAISETSEGSVQRRIRPLMAMKLGRRLNRDADANDIVISNGYFSWNARVGKGIVVFHGTELGRANATRAMTGRLRNLAVRTINARLDRRAAKGRTVVAVAESLRVELKQLYGIDADAVIPNGIDLDKFRPTNDKSQLKKSLGLPEDKFLILYAGPPDRRKGFDFLMNEVRPLLTPTQSLVVTTELKSPLSGVIPIGRLDFDRIVKCYQACDASVVPSYYEGFGYALAEALGCGLPSVTSNVGVARDLAADNVLSKYIVANWDPVEYERRLTELERSPAEAKLVSGASRRYAEKHFDIRESNKRFVELVNSVSAT